MVVLVLNDYGDFTELMTIPFPRMVYRDELYGPQYGHFISFGKDENYIFAYCSGSFLLVSLENKCVDVDGSKVQRISKIFSNDYISCVWCIRDF